MPVATPASAPVAQRFASFANRSNRDLARRAPPGDELVPLGDGNFGAKDAARGLITRPDGTYNFVRTQGARRIDQRMLISAKAGHAQLAKGGPVLYAGTVRFTGGALEWWSNFSGHYQPIAAFRAQAQLPEDKFVPWQKLQIQGTAMQRGLFRDRRPTAAPAEPAPQESGGTPGAGAAAKGEKREGPTGAAPGASPAKQKS